MVSVLSPKRMAGMCRCLPLRADPGDGDGVPPSRKPARVTTALMILSAFLLAAFLVWWAATRHARGRETALMRLAAPDGVSLPLPARVRDFALRGDATPGDLAARVRVSQIAEYKRSASAPWILLRGHAWIAIAEPGFVWVARQGLGPLTPVRVTESLTEGRGALLLQRFGLWRAGLYEGPEMDRAQAIRYLAELPWAPDAILGNAHLSWRQIDSDWVEVRTGSGSAGVSARFRFDPAGDIAEMLAQDWPMMPPARTSGSAPERSDLRVYYRSYRMIGPRRVPAEGEAGRIRDGAYRPYFQLRVTGCEAVH